MMGEIIPESWARSARNQHLFALVAAYYATKGAMSASKIQVDAMRNETSQRLRQEQIIAIHLLEGVISRAKRDIDDLKKRLEQPQFFGPDKRAPAEWRSDITKPPLSTVWNNLGACGPLIIDSYLLFDAEVDGFAKREITGVDYMKRKLADFDNIINRIENILSHLKG